LSTARRAVRFRQSPLMICESCTATLQPTRICEACGEVEGCRHHMRKYRVRVVGGEWGERIACEDWERCIMRCARKVMK